MRRWRPADATVFAVCLVLSAPLRAFAQPTLDQQALAATLFKEAKALLNSDRIPEACRKLEESERLDPSGGTLLNLAVCHEREGRTATAWVEFRDARIVAQQGARADREALADEHIRGLEQRLSKLVIRVPPSADVPGIEVVADGVEVRRAAWGTSIPVDPGEHVIAATAPGKKRVELRVTVGAEGDEKTVVVRSWEDAPAPAPAPTPPPSTEPAPTVPPKAELPAPARDRRGALVAVTVAGGAIAVGSFYGLRAITKHSQSDDACTTTPCGETSRDLNTSAKTAADISTGAFAVGLIGIGFAAYFWLFDKAPTTTTTGTLRWAPTFGTGHGTIDLVGTF